MPFWTVVLQLSRPPSGFQERKIGLNCTLRVKSSIMWRNGEGDRSEAWVVVVTVQSVA